MGLFILLISKHSFEKYLLQGDTEKIYIISLLYKDLFVRNWSNKNGMQIKFQKLKIDMLNIMQIRNNELALEKVQTENHNHALLLKMEQLQEEYATLVRNVEGIHKDLICPITLERFVDPVIARDGYVYERRAIQQWFDNNRRISPMTNGPLTDTRLTPCHKMKTIA